MLYIGTRADGNPRAAAVGKSTVTHMHSGTTVPLRRADPRAVYKYGCLYPHCKAAIEKGLMEHDSWAPSFWRSLVALPLPLQSYCQGNSERAACHLVHYRTEMVSGSREGLYPVPWNYFFLPLPETICLLFQQVP